MMEIFFLISDSLINKKISTFLFFIKIFEKKFEWKPHVECATCSYVHMAIDNYNLNLFKIFYVIKFYS